MAARELQRAQLLTDRGGHITVLDRSALERRSCACYAVVKVEHERPLPDEHPK